MSWINFFFCNHFKYGYRNGCISVMQAVDTDRRESRCNSGDIPDVSACFDFLYCSIRLDMQLRQIIEDPVRFYWEIRSMEIR